MFMRRVLMKTDVYTGFEYKLARQNGVQKVRGVGVGVDGGYYGRRQFVAGYEHPKFGSVNGRGLKPSNRCGRR